MAICGNKINYQPINVSGNETLDLFTDLIKLLNNKEKVFFIIEDIIKKYGRDFQYDRLTVFGLDSDWGFHYPTGDEIKDKKAFKNKIEFKNSVPYLF